MVNRLDLTDALTRYRQYLAARNLAPRTRVEYSADLADLQHFLSQSDNRLSVTTISKQQRDTFLAQLDHRGLSSNTRRRKISAIRSFLTFLEEQQLLTAPLSNRLVLPERVHVLPRVLSSHEYRRLLESVRTEPREQAIIELILQTGLRLSEVARLAVADVDLPVELTPKADAVGRARIQGRGRKRRTVPVNTKAAQALAAYLRVRDAEPDDDHLFVNKFGRGISLRSIARAVTKYLRAARIADASVHTLRHTFAAHHIKRGTKLESVRHMLGHESLKTTSIYVTLAQDTVDRELQENAL